MGDSLAAASMKFREGEISTTQFLDEILHGIPIIGDVAKGLQGLEEVITGEKAAAESAAKAEQEHAKAIKGVKDAQEERDRKSQSASTAGNRLRNEATGLSDQADLSTMPDGLSKDQYEAFLKYLDRGRNLAEELAAALKEAGANNLLGLQAKVADLTDRARAFASGRTGTYKGQVLTGNERSDLTQAQFDLDAATKSANDLKGAYDIATAASEKLFASDKTANTQKAGQEALKSLAKEALDYVKTWDQAFAAVQKAGAKWTAEDAAAVKAALDKAIAEAQRITESVATPQEKLQGQRTTLDALHAKGLLNDGPYGLAVQQNTAAQAKLVQDAADEKLRIQDQYNVAVSTDLAQEVAQAKLAYDQDVDNWRQALVAKQITQEQFNALVTAAENNRLAAVREAYAKRDVQAPEQAPATEGTQGFFNGAAAGIQQFANSASDASKAGQQLTLDIGNGLVNAFTAVVSGSKDAAKAFGEFAVSIIADIAKMILEAEIAVVLKAIFPSLFGGAVGHNQGGQVQAKNLGGLIQAFAGGGRVPGSGPNRDTVPAMLTPGEFVVRRSAVQQPGMLGILHSINSGMQHFAAGGVVGTPLAGVSAGGGGMGGTHVVPAVIASDANMRTLLAGGGNALIDFIRVNKSRVNGVLQ
jgi:hypothetical protein